MAKKTLNILRKSAVAFHKSHLSDLKQKTKPSLKNNMLKYLMSSDHLLKVLLPRNIFATLYESTVFTVQGNRWGLRVFRVRNRQNST